MIPGRIGHLNVLHSVRLPLAGIAVAVALAGCQIGPRNFENENDRLRAENLQLRQQVSELEESLELRKGEIQTLQTKLAGGADHSLQGIDPPVLSAIQIGRFSGGVDEDGDRRADLIRVYLEPVDQRGRVMPVAGRAQVQAVAIPPDGQPQTVATRLYEPTEFDEAWRSGFTGSHYTLELQLPEIDPAIDSLTVQVTFTQAETGTRFTEQQVMSLRR